MEDEDTRRAARSLVSNLRKVGQREEAEALADKHGLNRFLADLLEEQGKLVEAIPLYTKVLDLYEGARGIRAALRHGGHAWCGREPGRQVAQGGPAGGS